MLIFTPHLIGLFYQIWCLLFQGQINKTLTAWKDFLFMGLLKAGIVDNELIQQVRLALAQMLESDAELSPTRQNEFIAAANHIQKTAQRFDENPNKWLSQFYETTSSNRMAGQSKSLLTGKQGFWRGLEKKKQPDTHSESKSPQPPKHDPK